MCRVSAVGPYSLACLDDSSSKRLFMQFERVLEDRCCRWCALRTGSAFDSRCLQSRVVEGLRCPLAMVPAMVPAMAAAPPLTVAFG